jgi:hypothetical protein
MSDQEIDERKSWRLVVRCRSRAWWSLWILVRVDEVVLTRTASEEEVLTCLAELQAQFPKCDLELQCTS